MAQKDMEKNSQKSVIDIRSSLIRFSGEFVDGKCSYGRFCVFEAIFCPKNGKCPYRPQGLSKFTREKIPKNLSLILDQV